MAKMTIRFKTLLAGAVMACALLQAAVAAEIGGVKFDDTVKVAGKELKLNGVGLRTRFIVKVFAAWPRKPRTKGSSGTSARKAVVPPSSSARLSKRSFWWRAVICCAL